MFKLIVATIFCIVYLFLIGGNRVDAYFCKANEPSSQTVLNNDHLNWVQGEKEPASESVKDVLNLTAKSAILFDPLSNQVLFGDNINEKLPIASMTKMMTMLLVMEEIEKGNLSLNEECLVSKLAASQEGSKCFLDANSSYKVIDLLKTIAVASANDSCVCLAEKISGSVEMFVKKMNDRAKELNMQDTTFLNATGLDEKGACSTAYDMCLVMKELSRFDLISKLGKDWTYDFVHPSGRKTMLTNTNRLVRTMPQLYLAKTGHTDDAGYCITAYGKNRDLNLIACVMGVKDSSVRFEEVQKLLGYGFSSFKTEKLLDHNEPVGKIKVKGSTEKEINYFAKEDEYVTIEKEKLFDPKKIIFVPEYLSAPLEEGEKIGEVKIELDGNEKIFDLVVGESVEKQTFHDIVSNIISN